MRFRKGGLHLKISVAIDGPAGAGKSTIAKILAQKLDLMYINTGSMYRAVTLKAIEKDIPSENIEALCHLVDSLEMHFEGERLYVNGEDVTNYLTMPEISNNVSRYAAVKEIRQRLVEMQRRISMKYSVVMDGRDIGTVVLKNAAFKFFLTASPEERAKRRFNELSAKGIEVKYEDILSELLKRDYNDSHRETDPLVKADDALEVDTSGMTIDSVVNEMYSYIIKEIKIANT